MPQKNNNNNNLLIALTYHFSLESKSEIISADTQDSSGYPCQF